MDKKQQKKAGKKVFVQTEATQREQLLEQIKHWQLKVVFTYLYLTLCSVLTRILNWRCFALKKIPPVKIYRRNATSTSKRWNQ